MKRVAVITGDRQANQTMWQRCIEYAYHFHEVDRIIQGECPVGGIDEIAKNIAQDSQIEAESFEADFKHLGKKAGPIRNAEMARRLLELKEKGWDVRVIAFHPRIEYSKGTKNMVNTALKKGIPVYVYKSPSAFASRLDSYNHRDENRLEWARQKEIIP